MFKKNSYLLFEFRVHIPVNFDIGPYKLSQRQWFERDSTLSCVFIYWGKISNKVSFLFSDIEVAL